MASSNCASIVEQIDNYKNKLELLMRISQEKIYLLKRQKESSKEDIALNESIKELEDNALAIKTALKDVELLKSTVKLVTLSSEIIEGQKELEDYEQDIGVLKKKKAALKMVLSDTQDQRMDKDILICELQHQIQKLSLVNICPFEIDEKPDAKSNSDETSYAKGDAESNHACPSPDDKRSNAGSSGDEIPDAKDASQHMSSPN